MSKLWQPTRTDVYWIEGVHAWYLPPARRGREICGQNSRRVLAVWVQTIPAAQRTERFTVQEIKNMQFNPFTAMLAAPSLGNRPIKVANLKSLSFFLFFFSPLSMNTRKAFYRNGHFEIRFVIGLSSTLFDGVYVCTSQPRNLTCCGSEGVNISKEPLLISDCAWIGYLQL